MGVSKIKMSRGRQTLRILMFSLHLAPSKMDFLNIPSVLKTTVKSMKSTSLEPKLNGVVWLASPSRRLGWPPAGRMRVSKKLIKA